MSELVVTWQDRRAAMLQFGGLQDGTKIIDEMLADFEEVLRNTSDEVLNLTQAAAESGYTADHLGRLANEGKIVTVGRKHARKIRRGDLPRKPGAHADGDVHGPFGSHVPHIQSHAQIARSLVSGGETR